MSRTTKLVLASVLYMAMMYALYRIGLWAYEYVGAWIAVIGFAIFFPIGLYIDHRDRQRLG